MFSIVIPSKNPKNLIPCVQSILATDKEVKPEQIIVVDDGAKFGSEHILHGIRWVEGKKPFIFSRNCNLGFDAAGQNDVILLNDDVILKSSNGLSNLARVVQNYGIVSGVTNSVGNPNQRLRVGSSIRFEDRVLAFVCVGIARSVYEMLGRLDERYVSYGWEDNDYCKRALNAGLKLCIFDGCYVDHLSLTSTFRGPNGAAGNIEDGRKIYQGKWGLE